MMAYIAAEWVEKKKIQLVSRLHQAPHPAFAAYCMKNVTKLGEEPWNKVTKLMVTKVMVTKVTVTKVMVTKVMVTKVMVTKHTIE